MDATIYAVYINGHFMDRIEAEDDGQAWLEAVARFPLLGPDDLLELEIEP